MSYASSKLEFSTAFYFSRKSQARYKRTNGQTDALVSTAHDTRSRNRHYKSTPFSGADFWYVCHANLDPDSSGSRFRRRLEHCSIPSHKVACTTCDWSKIVDVFMCSYS